MLVTTALVYGALIPLFGVHAEYLANNPYLFLFYQFFNFIFELAWIFVIDKEPSDPDQVSKEGILDILKHGFFIGSGFGEIIWFGPIMDREMTPNDQVWLGNWNSFGVTMTEIVYNIIKASLPFPWLKNNLPEEVWMFVEIIKVGCMTAFEGARTMMFLLDPSVSIP